MSADILHNAQELVQWGGTGGVNSRPARSNDSFFNVLCARSNDYNDHVDLFEIIEGP
jgi:hypothetical protein